MAKQGSSTKQLKQTLGFWDLMSTAIGQIIGAGIMTLLGSAIALTGRSVPISFLIAAILVVGYSIPKILICGAVRARGGEYTMVAMLGGTRMAGIYTVVNTLSNLSLAMYSLSFASYFISLFGFGNEKVIALIVTTIFFLINIVGVDIMAKFQNLIVTMLCIALGLFAVVGLKYVQPDYLTNGFLTDGTGRKALHPKQSKMAETYSFPSQPLISVISVTHFVSGSSAWKSRFNRSSDFLASLSAFVIPFGLRLG